MRTQLLLVALVLAALALAGGVGAFETRAKGRKEPGGAKSAPPAPAPVRSAYRDDDDGDSGAPATSAPAAARAAPNANQRTDEGLVFLVEHALNDPLDAAGPQWTARGKLTARLARSARVGGVAELESFELSPAAKAQLQTLHQQRALYRVRVSPVGGSAPDAAPIFTSVPACLLVAAEFRETWTLHLDSYGTLFSLEYGVDASASPSVVRAACAPKKAGATPAKALPATVTLRAADLRAVRVAPAMVAERPVVELIDPVAAAAQAAPEPSFIRKYWYILLPVALVLLTGGGGGGGGGGSGGGS